MRVSKGLVSIFSVTILTAVLIAKDTNDLQRRPVSAESYAIAVGIVEGTQDTHGRRTLRVLENGSIAPVYLKPIKASSVGESSDQEQGDLLGSPSSGLFHPYVSYYVYNGADALAIGDVTGDGLNDVVAVNSSLDSIYVCSQAESGELNPHISYAAPITYQGTFQGSVDIADINNDGRLDVIAGMSNAVGVLFQNADGQLEDEIEFATAHSSFSNVYKLRTGDFNNDGLDDVASIDWGTQSHDVDIFLQTSTGLLSPSTVYTVAHGGYDDLTVGDLNNDGALDIIVMSGQAYAYDNLGVLTQNGAGTFDEPAYYDLGGDELTSGVGVGDVNGDGRDDIVVSYGGNRPRSFIGIFLQDDAGIVETAFSLPSYDIPEPVRVADINSDGREDVLTLHGGWNALGVYLQNSTGSLMQEELYSVPYASHYNPHGLAVGDLNGDSKPDVAIADYNSGIVILYNAAEPTVNVVLDIKPGSCPNPLNLNGNNDHGKAVLPVAVLGTNDLDVHNIDPSSVRLENVPATRWSFEDVAAPHEEEPGNCGCYTFGPDGIEDLTLKFSRSDIIAGLGGANHGDTITLEMTATLFEGGTVEGTDCVWIRNGGKPTDVTARPLTSKVVLYANTPNPFNPTTEIGFGLPNATNVKLEVYNIMGQRVTTLVNGPLGAGEHRVQWDGRVESGQSAATGIYIYRLQAGDFVETKKMLLLK